jgi:3-oxoacyl-[acyl-carrier protein] reductase
MSTSRLLQNKVALITGSNRGIGKAILETYACNGATIWACARKESEEFNHYLSDLSLKFNVIIKPLYFDLINEAEIKEIFNSNHLLKERIDILVNNAGIAFGGLFQMTSVRQLKNVFEVNFFSQVLITQYVSKIMIRQGSGSIINMSSVVGLDPDPGYLAYGSSKAALIYMTKVIAKELASKNIRINAIAPGLTETDMASQMEEKAKRTLIESSSMNRMASPTEIADAALFLASDMSSFITGQVIRVDGGMS